MKVNEKDMVTVVTMGLSFSVNRQTLAENLRNAQKVARALGRRPGQPLNLTKTKSDPISHERFSTLATIVDENSKHH